MTLRIYNTLTRTKEEFKPLDPKNVRMYVCGPTVYDFAHIGNARPAIVFDVLFRLLRHLYGPEHVTYVRNITDVDDKINARALRDHPGVPLNDAIARVTETTYDQYQKDVTALGCLPPTFQPRATEHIAGMVEMIRTLITRGHAYEAAGEVLFDVGSMKDYGRLAQRKLEDQQAGARVAVDAHKKNPADFVLWKLSSADEPGWESPWGRGRPGWHIECSVMSKHHLGEVFDIHGGGLDLIFPHHENEIAQSRCAHGSDVMANYWMHNGFLQVEGQKMSKSLGNFLTIRDLLDQYPGDVLRGVMLQTHYRAPIDWTEGKCTEVRNELFSWAFLLKDVWDSCMPNDQLIDERVFRALVDDLNTPEAYAALRESYQAARTAEPKALLKFGVACRLMGFKNLKDHLLYSNFVSGIDAGPDAISEVGVEASRIRASIANTTLQETKNRFANYGEKLSEKNLVLEIEADGRITVTGQNKAFSIAIKEVVAARLEARKAKDWKKSDELRDQLLTMGIQIKDSKEPVTGELKTAWEVAR